MAVNPIPNKERMKIPRVQMPERSAEERSRSFAEVNLGLSAELAEREAQRCIACAKPTCVKECPVGVDVRALVDLVLEGKYLEAAAKIREDNVLPAVTGRVCPQEEQCEGGCVLTKKGNSVAIGYLERFVADYERTSGKLRWRPDPEGPQGARL
jgi:glutamate synthase (NADPH/NADH) small chain